MPTEEENVQYLYLVLTHGGIPTIDWDAVGAAMDLKKGAVSKRWSRLKQSMEKGETPSGSVYTFLWLCVKHSTRDKVMNWNEIAEKCGTTSGAASKRYSRMKQAFEAGDAPPANNPSSPTPKTPSKATQRKSKATTVDGEATPTPKRKRASTKKVGSEDETQIKSEQEVEDEDVQSPKKVRVAKPKATPKPKGNGDTDVKDLEDVPMTTTEVTTLVKNEMEDGADDTFIDAKEWINDLVKDQNDDEDKDHNEQQAVRVDEWLSETA